MVTNYEKLHKFTATDFSGIVADESSALKAYGGQTVTAGSIIVRQRGSKVRAGQNVGKGSDDTLFAKVDGRVDFGRSRGKSMVRVIEEPILEEATA